MIINKLNLKNFGRFQNEELILKQGINVIYGENESGKSTIHSFLQSMLFGMKRLRGRASRTDTYKDVYKRQFLQSAERGKGIS